MRPSRRGYTGRRSLIYACSLPHFIVDSDTEKLVQQPHIGTQLGLRELIDDSPMLHDIEAIRQGGSEAKILLHQHDGKASRLECSNHLAELLYDHWRKALRDLIQQQQPRA